MVTIYYEPDVFYAVFPTVPRPVIFCKGKVLPGVGTAYLGLKHYYNTVILPLQIAVIHLTAFSILLTLGTLCYRSIFLSTFLPSFPTSLSLTRSCLIHSGLLVPTYQLLSHTSFP